MSKERFVSLCEKGMKMRGVDQDSRYLKRFRWEVDEILGKEKHDYFLDLFDRRVRYPYNQNNLLVCWLLGIVPDHNIDKDPHNVFTGDLPDIDVDYIPVVRDYLKNVWAPKTFGEEYVCNIGNYTTFGLKNALIDMARVIDQSRDEAQAITKNLEPKDEEGKPLTWDSAIKLYPELKKYADEHAEVTEAAKMMINRNRGMGVHAGGLIISSIPLHDLVPLVKRKDSPQASAWVEGLHGQDLQPVGLVKFDLLVISNLLQIARCCQMIKERHGLDGICNMPGGPDWSDVPQWRNDPKSIEMANSGDLKCIFQFDSEGMRALIKSGGVDRFEDLVAFSSLFRPGCLKSGMTKTYVERKKGRERYELHPLIEPILDKTYGVMVYQEQIMQILNVVGDIPLKDCETVRKAISKKKIESIAKYKDMFIDNGQKNLGFTREKMEEFFDQILSWSEYGFNKTLTEDTLINCVDGVKEIKDICAGDKVYSINEEGEQVQTEVVAVHDHGVIDVVEVTFDDGYVVKCTYDHKFLTEEGQKPLWEICKNNMVVLSSPLGEYAGEKEGWAPSEVRSDITDAQRTDSASGSLREMPLSEVAFERKEAHFPMRNGIPTLSAVGGTPSNLREVLRDQEAEYQSQNGEVEPRQFGSGAQGDIFRNRQKDFSKEGCSGVTGRSTAEVARKESGEVGRSYFESAKVSQEIKNGDLAANQVGLGAGLYPLWRPAEVCGLGEGKGVDRSGRLFSLLGNKGQNQQETCPVSQGASTGFDVKTRGFVEGRHNAPETESFAVPPQNWRDELGVVHFAQQYAPVTKTGHLVPRRVLRVVPVGKRQCYDLEVAISTHNFILPNGIATGNSHACAYTYISMWLIYLKAHYPHEFYTSMLTCETLADKIKDYKMEARVHGVDMHHLDINRSKENFTLEGETIFFGFSNVKGIGEAPAKRIVENQPYTSFEDFLIRCGTDASLLKPVIGLRCFRDRDPITLWKFAEHFKDCLKKCEAKRKRYHESVVRYEEHFREIAPGEKVCLNDLQGDMPFDDPYWRNKYDKEEFLESSKEVECGPDEGEPRIVMEEVPTGDDHVVVESEKTINFKKIRVVKQYNRWKELRQLWKRRQRTLGSGNDKAPIILPRLVDFNPDEYSIPNELLKEFRNPVICEEKYYGFAWIHELERSPDYRGNLTFDALRNDINQAVAPVEMQIKSVKRAPSRKGTMYTQVVAEDVTGQQNKINVWEEDWARWEQEFKVGNLLRVRLQPPSGGFNSFTLENNSNSRAGRYRPQKRYPDKDTDPRVVVMRVGQKEEEKFLTDEEALEQFDACTMDKTND